MYYLSLPYQQQKRLPTLHFHIFFKYFKISDDEEVDDETKTDSGNLDESRPEVSFGPIHLEDDPLPDVLVSVRPDPNLVPGLFNLENCETDETKQVNW